MKNKTPTWNAKDYAKNSSAQLKWAQELISKLILKGHEFLLDIGCGDGKITAQLAAGLPHGNVVGIDSSAAMVEHARQLFATKYSNLGFYCMDATRIQLDDKFDIAFSNATLHWVKNHLSVLQGVRDHLNPGGRILFQMGGYGNAIEMVETVNEVTQLRRWRNFFVGIEFPYAFYQPEDYEKWLPQSGFKPKRCELIPKDMQYNNLEGLLGWLRTTWLPYTERLPENLREEFLQQIVNNYAEAHPADEFGFTHVKMVRLEVEAVRNS